MMMRSFFGRISTLIVCISLLSGTAIRAFVFVSGASSPYYSKSFSTTTRPNNNNNHNNNNKIQSAATTTTTSIRANNVDDNDDDGYSFHDNDELPDDFPRRHDVCVALQAVRKAASVTTRLQPQTNAATNNNFAQMVQKQDTSPVTVADFAAQAIVLRHLKDCFHQKDSFIAEESSAVLRQQDKLAQQVLDAVVADNNNNINNLEELYNSIDLGKEYEHWRKNDKDSTTTIRPARVWCLDPIDGTKGFLRGKQEHGQYAIALALLENGVPTIGVLACPNLPVTDDDENNTSSAPRGCIFVASQGGGCYQLPLIIPTTTTPSPRRRLHVTTPKDRSPADGRFCLGVEKAFSDALGQCSAVMAKVWGQNNDNNDNNRVVRRMDSQAKYGVLARAGGEYYARFPAPGYIEWIWDHAAGKVVVEEAGGVMTDTNGEPIDFSLGAKMSESVKGVLASCGGVFHDALVKAYKEQEVERLQAAVAEGAAETTTTTTTTKQ